MDGSTKGGMDRRLYCPTNRGTEAKDERTKYDLETFSCVSRSDAAYIGAQGSLHINILWLLEDDLLNMG